MTSPGHPSQSISPPLMGLGGGGSHARGHHRCPQCHLHFLMTQACAPKAQGISHCARPPRAHLHSSCYGLFPGNPFTASHGNSSLAAASGQEPHYEKHLLSHASNTE